MDVDLLFLSRDSSPPRGDVWQGIECQLGVRLHVHRLIGTPRPEDSNRFETICRARNGGKHIGANPLVLLLDDDVVLAPGCVAKLVAGLQARTGFAALAADSAGEMAGGWQSWDYPTHVGMAAVLFRREQLDSMTFRWNGDKCECRCCCEDLRRAGYGIGYLPGAIAWHRPFTGEGGAKPENSEPQSRPNGDRMTRRAGRVLSAFNRRDYRRFCQQFIPTFRAAGNREIVTAVTYGLYPSEAAALCRKPGVEVVAIADNGVCPALRRLCDFQSVIAAWPEDTPVAFWDAGDVQFQSHLEPLWEMVRANPDVLLVAREPLSYPENPVIRTWTDCIRDPSSRRRAFDLMSSHTFLNSGFGAGMVPPLLRYLREADQLLNSPALEGVGDWGDQPAMNLFCYTNPGSFQEIWRGWNFALAGRDPGEYRVTSDGRFHTSQGESIQVVHGNSGTLRWKELPLMA
jgi:hypothetical protein